MVIDKKTSMITIGGHDMEQNDQFTHDLQQKDHENVWHHMSMYNDNAPLLLNREKEHGLPIV